MSPDRAYGRHPNPYPGKLFIVEGIDGSGKSTQLALLAQWLRSEGTSSSTASGTRRRS